MLRQSYASLATCPNHIADMSTTHHTEYAAVEPADVLPGPTEYELLLHCVQRAMGLSRRSLSTPAARFDWCLLLDLARRHEVLPLLSVGLSDDIGTPSPVRRQIAAACRVIVAHNLSLTSELADILDALERSGIHAVPFKGPAWTKLLYGNLVDRQIADLDLFVDDSQIAAASQVLCDRGYVTPPVLEVTIREDSKDVGFFHPETCIHLELHWSACEVWRDHRLAHAKLWVPHSTTTLLHRQVPLPSKENIFLLLAIHGFRDNWQSLKWLCDIAAFLHAFPDMDWNTVLSEGAKLSRKRLVLLPLALVARLLHVNLPPSVAKAIAGDRIVGKIAEEIHRRNYMISGLRSEKQGVLTHIYLEWMRLQVRDSIFERCGLHLKFLFELIKPNENDRALSVGGPEPLYWLLRPYRLFQRYGIIEFLRFSLYFIARSSPRDPRN
jgi:hypothetical protein